MEISSPSSAPLVLSVASCICSFSPLLYFWGTLVIPIDAEHLPLGEALTTAVQMTENLNTWQVVYTLLMYCIPLTLLLVVGLGSFVFIREYQNQSAAPQKPYTPEQK